LRPLAQLAGSLNEQLSGKVATPVGPKMSSKQRRSLKGTLIGNGKPKWGFNA